LFENTDDGFAFLEPIFDETGNCVDLFTLKINEAWECQAGFRVNAGILVRRISEVLPGLEPN
jgi:hypothetical protein